MKVAAATAAVYGVLSTLVGAVVVHPTTLLVQPASALPLPLTLVFGPAAAVGSAVGVLVADLAVGSLAPLSAFEAAGQFLLGFLGLRYWRELGSPGAGAADASGLPRTVPGLVASLPRLVPVAVLSSCGVGAFLAWGGELLGVAPFFLTAFEATVDHVLATVPLGLPLLFVLVPVVGDEARPGSTDREGLLRSRRARSPWMRGLLLVIPVGWLVAGTVGAVGYRVLETVPAAAFADRGLGFVSLLYRPVLFGPGAVNVQVVFGSLVLVAFGLLVVAGPGADHGDGKGEWDRNRNRTPDGEVAE